MITEWDEWTDILVAFARHVAPDMPEDEVEIAVEEYIEANSMQLLGHFKPLEDD
jgi:hypothetical protein